MIQIAEHLLSMKELLVQMASSTFLGGNYSLYYAKIAIALHFQIALTFSFFTNMSKWPKIA